MAEEADGSSFAIEEDAASSAAGTSTTAPSSCATPLGSAAGSVAESRAESQVQGMLSAQRRLTKGSAKARLPWPVASAMRISSVGFSSERGLRSESRRIAACDRYLVGSRPLRTALEEAKCCRIDGLPCAKHKSFCVEHFRAFECIRRGALKASAEDLENFNRIFGSKNSAGLPTVADKVLSDYVAAFPDGKARKGVKRGNVNLTTYIRDFGSKRAKQDQHVKQILDREVFTTKLEQLRKWNAKRSGDMWEQLEADPANHYDDNGPPWAPKRLKVPGWLLGSDFEADVRENFETKTLRTTSKTEKNMTHETREQILAELPKGFGHLQSAQSAGTGALPSTAWTSEGADLGPITPLGVLGAVAQQHLPQAPGRSQAKVAFRDRDRNRDGRPRRSGPGRR